MGVRNIARLAIDPETNWLTAALGRAGRVVAEPGARPGEVRDRDDHHRGGQPRLAVLHGQQAAVPRPQQHRRGRPHGLVRLRQPGEHLAAQHRSGEPAAGQEEHDLVLAGRWRPGVPEPPEQRHPDLRRRGRDLHPAVPARWRPGDHVRARPTTTTRWTPSSGVAWPKYWDDKWFIGDESNSANRVAVTVDPAGVPTQTPPAFAETLRQIIPSRLRRHPAAELDGRQVRSGRRAVHAGLRQRLLQPGPEPEADQDQLHRRRRRPRRRPRRTSRCRTSR